MLLWLNQFLSALYSPIFWDIFNRSDIRLDSLERKVAPKWSLKCTQIHSPDGVHLVAVILWTIVWSIIPLLMKSGTFAKWCLSSVCSAFHTFSQIPCFLIPDSCSYYQDESFYPSYFQSTLPIKCFKCLPICCPHMFRDHNVITMGQLGGENLLLNPAVKCKHLTFSAIFQ